MTTALNRRRKLTPRQFLHNEGELVGYELVDGYLEKKSMSAHSSFLNGRAYKLITEHVDKHKLGWTFDSECSYTCSREFPTQVRKPDVSFIRFGRFAEEVLPEGYITLVPDLVVEVISPNERYLRLKKKLREFIAAGVPLIWVVDSDSRVIQVHRPNQPMRELQEDEIVSGESILPGFAVTVAEFMPRKPN